MISQCCEACGGLFSIAIPGPERLCVRHMAERMRLMARAEEIAMASNLPQWRPTIADRHRPAPEDGPR